MYQQLRETQRCASNLSAESSQPSDGEETSKEEEVMFSKERCGLNPPTLTRADIVGSSTEDSEDGGEETATGDDETRRPPQSTITRIKERYVIDDRGWWVVFDVPEDHYLHNSIAATNPYLVPKDALVEVHRGILSGREIASGHDRHKKPDSEDLGFRRMFGEDTCHSLGATTEDKGSAAVMGSQRDLKIAELEKELTRVKGKLTERIGRGKRVTMACDETTAAESAYDTVDEATIRRQKKRTPSASEASHTEFDTAPETDRDDVDVRKDGKQRRRPRPLRRAGSDVASDSIKMTEDVIESVVQRCLATAMPTIIEGKEVATGVRRAGGKERDGGEKQQVPVVAGRVDQPAISVLPTSTAFNPHMMPLMKFNGENWEDFIEHFESFADACGMSDAYKLQYLLMSLEGKPRAYAKKEDDVPFTFVMVKQRLQHRYGKKESAFEIRHQLRSVQRKPGETLEEFSDRLQEIAQQGKLDDKDRDELFYFAFLNAVGDIPKMQYFIEQAHSKNRNLKLSDLLALAREYLEKSPTARRRSVAVNVCKPISQRKGRLTHDDDDVNSEVEAELRKIDQERKDKKETNLATIRKDVAFLLKESEFHNRCIKLNGLHLNLK